MTAPLSTEGRVYVKARLVEELPPVWERSTPFGPIKFYCLSRQTYTRASKAPRKEPDMNAWLKTMPPGSVFWDIGANVGTYTLFAAAKGLTVYAFEPEATNFHLLQRNIDVNEFNDRATALNFGLSDRTGLAPLELASEVVGGAKHKIREGGDSGRARCRNVMAFTGRDLLQQLNLPSPNYIKIDVDGFELPVVRGLDLDDGSLREVMVELRGNGDAPDVLRIFSTKGFVTDAPIARVAPGDKAFNALFHREEGGRQWS